VLFIGNPPIRVQTIAVVLQHFQEVIVIVGVILVFWVVMECGGVQVREEVKYLDGIVSYILMIQ
jgi:hypothetical protein